MIQKKVCMLGAFATGKTSLVSRFVTSVFSEKYLTTVGVKIDKHEITVDDREMALILWDLYGEDEFQRVRRAYVRGSAGLLYVVDGTRVATWETVVRMQGEEGASGVPFVVAVNKSDLRDQWEIPPGDVDRMRSGGWTIVETSAKTGRGVEEVFGLLARKMLRRQTIGTP